MNKFSGKAMRYQSQSNLVDCWRIIQIIRNAVGIRKGFEIVGYGHAFIRTFIVDGVVLPKDFCNGGRDGRAFWTLDNHSIQPTLPFVQNKFRMPGKHIIPLLQLNLKTGEKGFMPVDMVFCYYNKKTPFWVAELTQNGDSFPGILSRSIFSCGSLSGIFARSELPRMRINRLVCAYNNIQRLKIQQKYITNGYAK